MVKNKSLKITPLTEAHWPRVREIYQKGMETGLATFETEVPCWEMWDKSHLKACRFVAMTKGKVSGWVALSEASGRCCYKGVTEISIYVDPDEQGKGIGSALLSTLIREAEDYGIWTLQAGIFPENIQSLKLHKKHGFRIIGIREKIGKLNNQWRNIILMEKRSKRVGID